MVSRAVRIVKSSNRRPFKGAAWVMSKLACWAEDDVENENRFVAHVEADEAGTRDECECSATSSRICKDFVSESRDERRERNSLGAP